MNLPADDGRVATGHAAWGHAVERGRLLGRDVLTFARRPADAGAMLADIRRWGPRDCLVQGAHRLSYAALDSVVAALRRRMGASGLSPGDRVALTGYASPSWVVALWACLASGLVAVPCNPQWDPNEQARVARITAPALQVGEVGLAGCPAPRIADAARIGPPSGARPAPTGPAGEEAPALIMFTAGTTGPARGVTLSHGALVAGIQNMLAPRRLLPCDIGPDHRGPVTLISLPLFHIGGLTSVIAGMLCGGRLVFTSGRFDPSKVMNLIERERVTTWGAIPTMVARAVEAGRRRDHNVASLRSLMIGGATVHADLLARAREVFPGLRHDAGNTYGLTEACGHVTTATGQEVTAHPGTSGRPLPVSEVTIAPHQDAPVGHGEVLVRSPGLLSGYWGETLDPVDAHGWLHTGDLGRLDDGRLYLAGRLKDIIIRGGENISAARVEECLSGHQGVLDVAVVGLGHADLGEEVAAVVVARPGHRVTAAELRAFAAARLARFEVPTRWWIRSDELPVNAAGKTLKRELRASWPEGATGPD